MNITENIARMILANMESAASEGIGHCDDEFYSFLKELLERFPNVVENRTLWWMDNYSKK